MADWCKQFKNDLPEIAAIFDEPMSCHTSFRIGGPADLLAMPKSAAEAAALLKWAKKNDVPYFVMGNGSNLLVRDGGIRGMVVQIGERMAEMTAQENSLTFGAGLRLSQAANFALEQNLSGMEFAQGIPGSVGGAIYMNAGAYGGEMKDIVLCTEYLTPEGEPGTLQGEAHGFGYRTSAFAKSGSLVVRTTVLLLPEHAEAISAKMRDFAARRKAKQPLEYPSAGSTFKRPEGHFAGQLIEACGLKGKTVGAAQVSEKHAGFLINRGGATAQEMLDLIAMVQDVVEQHFGMRLECEVKIVGEQ